VDHYQPGTVSLVLRDQSVAHHLLSPAIKSLAHSKCSNPLKKEKIPEETYNLNLSVVILSIWSFCIPKALCVTIILQVGSIPLSSHTTNFLVAGFRILSLV